MAVAKFGDELYFGGDFADMGGEESKLSFNLVKYNVVDDKWLPVGYKGLSNGTVNGIFALNNEEVGDRLQRDAGGL